VTLKFGTDGARGVANTDLTPELVLALGRAAARVLGGGGAGGRAGRPMFLIGRDTRVSGPLLQAALSAGLASEGAEVRDLGVMPTPGVAALSAARDIPAAMISASHNPFPDNGIKLFAAGGRKLADDVEQRLEAELGAILAGTGTLVIPPTGLGVGRLLVDQESLGWYEERLVASLEGRRLGGIKVALDCANGAASVTAADVFTRAGADVVAVVAADPDGTNINDGCGSTYPARLQAAVVEHGADVGLAFDGDADRVIAVDHTGALVDGDQLIALCALDLRERDRLAEDTVVVTVMTNLGFRLAMQEHGVHVHETQVGDRYVLEALDRGGWSLGGEQSGHVIFRDLATTGDGVLTGLQLLDQVVRQGRRLAELAGTAMSRLPQVLRNVKVADLEGLAGAESVWAAVAEVEAELGQTGRVLLRSSGTERLIRVMVEAPTESAAEAATARLIQAVTLALGAGNRRSGDRRSG
jgi:phosphoglucosamine mutase